MLTLSALHKYYSFYGAHFILFFFRLRALLVPSFPFPPRFTPSPKQAPARRRRHARLRIVPRRAAPSSRTR